MCELTFQPQQLFHVVFTQRQVQMRTESAQRRSVLRPVPAEVQHRQQEAVRSHAHVQLQLEQEAQNRSAHKQVLEARESFPPVRTPASS